MGSSGDPALRLLASALRLWIRQQCQALEALELTLEGSALRLLRGQLQGAHLEAQGVRFESLELEQVELISEAIQLQMPNPIQGRPLQLEEPFAIAGRVSLTPQGLQRSLTRESWRPLGEELARTFLDSAPLASISSCGEALVLSSAPPEEATGSRVELMLTAEQNSIALRCVDPDRHWLMPMDPAIHITRAAVETGLVVLEGRALVTP